MRGTAKFDIIGYVGSVKAFDKTRKIRIASPDPYKDEGGDWHDNPQWNTVTVFQENVVAWIDGNLVPGDLVHAAGKMRESSYKNGEGDIVYTVEFVAREFDRLVMKQQLDSTKNQKDDKKKAA